MKNLLTLLFLSFLPIVCLAQQDSTSLDKKLEIGIYIDNYWGLDFNNPDSAQRPLFIYNYARNNSFSTNLAIIEARYKGKNWYASLAFQAGDFSVLNLPAQSPLLRSLYNSTIGIEVSKKVTVEVGLKPSYLAVENLQGYQDLALTRSLLVDNVPYFFPGVRVIVDLKKDWYFNVHANNGWLNNQNTIFNQGKSLGLELQYLKDDENTLSFVLYSGNETQSETFQETLMGDFHFRFTLSDRWKVLFTSYVGVRRSKTLAEFQTWGGVLAVGQYQLNRKFSVTGRYQYFFDPNRVVIVTPAPGKFIIHGVSANLNYQVNDYIKFRAEALQFLSTNDVLLANGIPTDTELLITAALQVYFPFFP